MITKSKTNYSEDLRKVEDELNLQLPEFLFDFYNKESELIQKLKNVLNDEDHIYLTTDFDWMILHNRDFLKLPSTEGICRNKICIGTDGCGNDSFISLVGNDKRVFFIDHEIAGDLLDNSINDFMWEDERLEKYDSLREYTSSRIEIFES